MVAIAFADFLFCSVGRYRVHGTTNVIALQSGEDEAKEKLVLKASNSSLCSPLGEDSEEKS
jgi:hypothetical protein